MRGHIGMTLHDHLVRCLLAGASQLPSPMHLEPLETGLKRELLELLASLQTRSLAWEAADGDQTLASPPTKRSRTTSAIDLAYADKTAITRTLLVNKISLRHMVSNFLDTERLRIQLLRQPEALGEVTGEHLYDRNTIGRHMLLLDSALDSLAKEKLQAARDRDPGAFGVALATDESPPSQRRFGGYRFQVTMLYIPKWWPMETWETSATPPLDVSSTLLDICHCPGKDGASVMKVVDKQLLRLGLSRFDVVSMVGDGGGENEGIVHGMHAQLEADVPGYVRRRCLGHLAWRVTDAVIAGIPDYNLVKRLAEYLGTGVTWSRLQALAVTPRAEHGLGLFNEGSRAHARSLGSAPGAILEGRPESDMHFMRFLSGKEQVLHETASRDVEDRDLTRATKQAVAILGNHIGRAQRRVCAEVLRRSLFLHHWINSHRHISRMETLATLAERAKAIIQDVSLDDATMVRLGCDQALLAARGWTPATWLDIAATLEYDDQELAQAAIADVTKLHLELTTRGTAHLSLVIENIMRTSWLAGATLQPNPVQAQTAAQELLRHLDTVAPARRSAFEQHLADTDELLEALRAFAARKVAVCLWKGQGEYRVLFQFLAMRFLLAPDQVLDCERSHARWN